MPLTTQLKVEPGLLFATVTGVNEDLKGALAYMDLLTDACIAHSRRRLLVDECHARHEESMHAAWVVAEHLTDRRITTHLDRVACVPHAYSWILARLFVHMVSTRGLHVRLFKSMDDARAWIESP